MAGTSRQKPAPLYKLDPNRAEEAIAWCKGRLYVEQPCFAMLAIVNGKNQVCGAVFFNNWNGSNIEGAYAGPVSRGIARTLASICFDGLKANRITVRVGRFNKHLLRSLPKLGFRPEGVMKRYYGPHKKHDAIVFGLLRQDASRLLKVIV